jgi:hypothetical protein
LVILGFGDFVIEHARAAARALKARAVARAMPNHQIIELPNHQVSRGGAISAGIAIARRR